VTTSRTPVPSAFQRAAAVPSAFQLAAAVPSAFQLAAAVPSALRLAGAAPAALEWVTVITPLWRRRVCGTLEKALAAL
jgi:hypothetical protein